MRKPTGPTPPALSIRKARTADLPSVWSIECEQFSNPWPLAYFQAELGNHLSHFFVAEEREGQALAGFMIFWRLDSELELHKIAVVRQSQRRGYGSCLLDFFIRLGRSWHCHQAVLEVRAGNEAAIRLYAKAGFLCVGRRRDYYSQPAEDALVFRLDFNTN